MPQSLLAPPLLKPGDPVAVIAPSSRLGAEPFEKSLAVLAERYDVRVRPDIGAQGGFFAGSDAQRAAELREAIQDPAIKAIFCARGGHGAARVCEHVDLDALRKRPKWIVGFSDSTVLLAKWAQAGLQAVHGPHVIHLDRLDAAERERLYDTLEKPDWSASFAGLTVLRTGEASGPLLGGTLTLLCTLIGTPDFPPTAGCVLLLEDVNERPYRVDRMLTQLRRAGLLKDIAGVALGRFSGSIPEDNGVTVDEVLAERLGNLPCPVVSGLPIGHDGPNASVRLGAVVRIAGDRLEYTAS